MTGDDARRLTFLSWRLPHRCVISFGNELHGFCEWTGRLSASGPGAFLRSGPNSSLIARVSVIDGSSPARQVHRGLRPPLRLASPDHPPSKAAKYLFGYMQMLLSPVVSDWVITGARTNQSQQKTDTER